MTASIQSSLMPLVSSGEKEIAEQLTKRIVRKGINKVADIKLDWTGEKEEETISLEKAGLISLKILATAGATAAIIFLPHICLPILGCSYHAAISSAAAVVAKGAILGTNASIDQCLTKEITNNYTPNPENRAEYGTAMKYLRKSVSIGTDVLGVPHTTEIITSASILQTTAMSAYDIAPEKANEAIDKIHEGIEKIKNLFK